MFFCSLERSHFKPVAQIITSAEFKVISIVPHNSTFCEAVFYCSDLMFSSITLKFVL